MAPIAPPEQASQRVVAFCKYGETAQQALAAIAQAINEHMHGSASMLAVETIGHTVTQLAEPIPPIPGIGDPGPGHFVVTALVTFRRVGRHAAAGGDPVA